MVSYSFNTSPDRESGLDDILSELKKRNFLIVSSRRRNGLIIYKQHYAEFAGPGALVGGIIDPDVTHLIPVGNWLLASPEDERERQRAILMRRQWIKLFNNTTTNTDPHNRVKLILNQFENWFDPETVTEIPDDAIARLVGVLPETVIEVRKTGEW
ncbi:MULTISPECIES: hypothetical protein [Spirulina sp. CCY15215]|uniref:hypothetical protein n=1 Tax=Spirulina sp. CCY15215 TaxID=2767591 RepID=UPI00195020F5|nr:hypothetical protein [Spirulina major]